MYKSSDLFNLELLVSNTGIHNMYKLDVDLCNLGSHLSRDRTKTRNGLENGSIKLKDFVALQDVEKAFMVVV